MVSKQTQSKMNSLFQDTRMFNMSSVMYNSELSKPGALEELDKDYESHFKSNATLRQSPDFKTIRSNHKLDYEVSQLSPFQTKKSTTDRRCTMSDSNEEFNG